MKKYIPSALLATIIVLIGGATFAVVTHGLQQHTKKGYDVKHCATLESSDVTVCTKTKLIKQAASVVVTCLQTKSASTCSGELYSEITTACKQNGGADAGCARDSLRVISVIEASLTGDSVPKVLKQVGVSQR